MLKKLLRISPVIIIMNLSVLLLVYFGHGEAQRTYWKFKLDKMITQSRIVRDLMDDFLNIGLPLSLIKDFLEKKSALGQFAGFSVFSDPDGNSRRSDITLSVVDNDGRIIFSNRTVQDNLFHPAATLQKKKTEPPSRFDYQHTTINTSHYSILEGDDAYRMTLPLHDKFAQVGHLIVTLSKAPVQNFLQSKFAGVWHAAFGICVVLVVLIVVLEKPWAGRRCKTCLGIGYAVASLITASLIVATLISIYTHGAEDKIRSLSKSLTNRLSAISESNVDFNTVYGLDAILRDYQKLDPDIHTVALVDDGVVKIHPDAGRVGLPWHVPHGQKAYAYKIKNSRASVVVTMDESIIRHKVLLAVKNLATLIAASFFIGFLTFNVGAALRSAPVKNAGPDQIPGRNPAASHCLYETMMPVWFLIVFAESLNLSFLPKYLNDICALAQTSSFSSSLLFSAFFIGFALILVPSGYLADRWSDKYLIMTGILCFAAAMGLMGVTQTYALVLIVRFLTGASQGIVFIGVQNYIRKIARHGKMSQGGAVIVFSFNGAIIAGSAIGSIVLANIGIHGIFFSAATISMAAFCFTLLYVPQLPVNGTNAPGARKTLGIKKIANQARILIKDGEFLRTLFFVGAASKLTFTGITIYAVPLLMIQLNYTQADIGLAIMLYASAVLFSNYYLSKWADRTGNLPLTLFCGILVSSIGILVIGLVEWKPLSAWLSHSTTCLFFGGMLLLGVANGAISSPVVSHIMETRTCRKLGEGAGIGAYRLFERMGHVAGPLVVGQLFAWSARKTHAVLLVGVMMAAFGMAFLLTTDRKPWFTHYRQLHSPQRR